MKQLATKSIKMKAHLQFILLFCLAVIGLNFCQAAPLRLTPEGATGNPNDGLGMSVEELRKQLDDYWTAGDFHKFYVAGTC